MNRIFIDTEFSDFKNMNLISIGAVIDNNNFYEENQDIERNDCSVFVKEHVFPLLSNKNKKYKTIAQEFYMWLSACPDDTVIMGDYMGDWLIINRLLENNLPSNIVGFALINETLAYYLMEHYEAKNLIKYQKEYMNVKETFENALSKYMNQENKYPHHALDDAHANQYAFNIALQYISTLKYY